MLSSNNILTTIYTFLYNKFSGDSIAVTTDSTTSTITVEQANPDDLNVNANLQIGDADIDSTNPLPIQVIVDTITPTNLVTTQDLTAAYADAGVEIDCSGVNYVNLFVDFTVNDSTTNELQVLARHTTAGSDYIQESTIDYQKVIGDSSTKIVYQFAVTAIPFIQVQVKTTTVGVTAGTITIDYTKL